MSYASDTKVLKAARTLDQIASALQQGQQMTPAEIAQRLAELAQQLRAAVEEAEQDY